MEYIKKEMSAYNLHLIKTNKFKYDTKDAFLKEKMLEYSPLTVSLTGSGPTWFALYQNEIDAQTAKNNLENQNIECFVVAAQDKAIIFE